MLCFVFFYFFYLLPDQYSFLQVLYHVLGVVPSYQASIGPALNELSLGLQPAEVASVRMLDSICIVQLCFCTVLILSLNF